MLPPNQQLAAPGKWPLVGERSPRADDRPWTVTVAGRVAAERTWTLADLRAMPQAEQTVDVHCVTRWSRPQMRFRGVPVAELLAACAPLPEARYLSFVARSERNHSTSLPLAGALELGVLAAMEAEGDPIPSEHGGPVRTVTPGRYFYKSLKWLETIEVLAEDRPGTWEAEAGYHNHADPWLEQRYMAPDLDRREVARLLAARDFNGRVLRSIEASGMDLGGLTAREAILRDARFRNASLGGADFSGANLSNAQLQGADLRNASFTGADVEGADFVGADLRGADFTGASLCGATFWDPASGAGALLDPGAQFTDLEALAPEQAAYVRSRQRPGC